MFKIKAKITDIDKGYRQFNKRFVELKNKPPSVAIGLFRSKVGIEPLLDYTIHEFGGKSYIHEGSPAHGSNPSSLKIRYIKKYDVTVSRERRSKTGKKRMINIPQRSYLRGWISADNDKIVKEIKEQFNKYLLGKQNLNATLRALGNFGMFGVVKNIIRGDFVPNAPITIEKKKSDRPLIDTGHLLESIKWMIIKK